MLIGLGGVRARLPPRVARWVSRAVYRLGELTGEWDDTDRWHHPTFDDSACYYPDRAGACVVCQGRAIRHRVRLERELRGRDPHPDAPSADGKGNGQGGDE